MKKLFALTTTLALFAAAVAQPVNNASTTSSSSMLITDFTVTRNMQNQVEIKINSSVQADVDKLVVERSTDGKNFQPLFTIPPTGARNVYTKYAMVDKTPAQGNNYYRLAEIRLNGKWHYYTTKLITITTKGQSFNAYYNGGQVVTNVNTLPGIYEVALSDMSGVIIARKNIDLHTGDGQMVFDAPGRTGIYLVTVKGHGFNELTRVAVTR